MDTRTGRPLLVSGHLRQARTRARRRRSISSWALWISTGRPTFTSAKAIRMVSAIHELSTRSASNCRVPPAGSSEPVCAERLCARRHPTDAAEAEEADSILRDRLQCGGRQGDQGPQMKKPLLWRGFSKPGTSWISPHLGGDRVNPGGRAPVPFMRSTRNMGSGCPEVKCQAPGSRHNITIIISNLNLRAVQPLSFMCPLLSAVAYANRR
jgi:hypothetical protein